MASRCHRPVRGGPLAGRRSEAAKGGIEAAEVPPSTQRNLVVEMGGLRGSHANVVRPDRDTGDLSQPPWKCPQPE